VLHQHSSVQQFQILVERDEAAAMLRLTGEMDISCEDAFAATVRACIDAGATDVLVDLSQLTFIDSSGLRMLIQLWDKSRNNGLDLSMLQGTGQVRRTMEIAGLDHLLPILDRGSSRA
jgi:anti-anti-sigma factor